MRDSDSSTPTTAESFSAGPVAGLSWRSGAHDGSSQQGRPAAQLDKRGATLTPAPATEEVQISRWRLKHKVANILRRPEGETSPGVCKCGAAGYGSEEVLLTRRNGRPGVSGVYFCDSPWLCPTCAPRRAAQRAEKVQEVFNAVEARSGQVVFLTLTIQHRDGEGLGDLKRLVMDACRKARQGRPWALAVERYGIAGTMVGPEVTWSKRHGWHFHLHLAVPMLVADPAKAEEGGEWLMERYRAYIARAGGRAARAGQDVTVVWRREDLAAYLAKGSASWEVASAGATKNGRKGLTPWDLAARAAEGDARAAALFQEYASVMPGTRSCVITKALADRLGLKPHEDEDAPGVEAAEDDAEIVGSMVPPRWHRVLRHGHAADVLKAVGDGWEWPAIDAMVRRLLHEEEQAPASVRRPPEHAPTAEELARKALATATCEFRGRKGQAVQVVLSREAAYAKGRGLVFVQPSLREVLQLVA